MRRACRTPQRRRRPRSTDSGPSNNASPCRGDRGRRPPPPPGRFPPPPAGPPAAVDGKSIGSERGVYRAGATWRPTVRYGRSGKSGWKLNAMRYTASPPYTNRCTWTTIHKTREYESRAKKKNKSFISSCMLVIKVSRDLRRKGGII